MNKVILAVGAHPDDIELGCAGTLRNHVLSGDKVYGLVLTRGERGNHYPDCRECMASARVLGLEDVTVLEFKDGELNDDYPLISEIERYVKMYIPDAVYGHTYNDRHQDHRKASLATASAARFVSSLFFFESPSATVEFTPHYFTIITKTLEQKIRALSEYQSQLKKSTSFDPDWVRAQALFWRNKANHFNTSGKVYVEAFEINHLVG